MRTNILYKDPIISMLNDFDCMINQKAFKLQLSVTEDSRSYKINIDMPGVLKENIILKVDNNLLKISVLTKAPELLENEKIILNEKFYGQLSRELELPKNIDSENIVAKYENGVLAIILTKTDVILNKSITIQ